MSFVGDIVKESIDAELRQRLKSQAQRDAIVSAVMAGFAKLGKKPVTDLNVRTSALEARVRAMAESLTVGFVNGRLVVNVAGSSEATIKELRYGSNWYAPWDKVDETLIAAALADPLK